MPAYHTHLMKTERIMRKAIIITCISLAGLIVLDQSGILNSLFVFLLVGAVPGTNYTLPPTLMLLLIISAIWLIVIRFTALEAFYSVSVKKVKKQQHTRQKRMPKRRFSEVV